MPSARPQRFANSTADMCPLRSYSIYKAFLTACPPFLVQSNITLLSSYVLSRFHNRKCRYHCKPEGLSMNCSKHVALQPLRGLQGTPGMPCICLSLLYPSPSLCRPDRACLIVFFAVVGITASMMIVLEEQVFISAICCKGHRCYPQTR